MGDVTLHIALIGPRRAGKSTVGPRLANRMGLPSRDVDDAIVSRCGGPLGPWIAKNGWAAFRDMERDVLAAMIAGPRSVISTGGGVVLHRGLHAAMRAACRIIYLRAHPDVLAVRAKCDPAPGDRPALVDASPSVDAHIVFADRDAAYRELCHEIVDADDELDRVVERAFAVSMQRR